MDLVELLSAAGGQKSLGKLAGDLGIGTDDVGKLVASLAPALGRGLQRETAADGGLSALQGALSGGGHQRYLDDPDLMSDPASRDDGNNILGHIFGSKDVSRNVAAQAASTTGIGADLIKKALPLIAGLAMGALSRESNSGQNMDTGILGSLLGGGDGDGDFGLDDVLDLAKKFF